MNKWVKCTPSETQKFNSHRILKPDIHITVKKGFCQIYFWGKNNKQTDRNEDRTIRELWWWTIFFSGHLWVIRGQRKRDWCKCLVSGLYPNTRDKMLLVITEINLLICCFHKCVHLWPSMQTKLPFSLTEQQPQQTIFAHTDICPPVPSASPQICTLKSSVPLEVNVLMPVGRTVRGDYPSCQFQPTAYLTMGIFSSISNHGHI